MTAKKLREPPVSADAADLALGVRLRQIREARRISRRIVAAGLGVSPQQVEKYETGLTRLSIGRLLRFAAVLDVAPAALLMNLHPGADSGSPGPDDPIFADACAAFGHLARIRESGLREAMLNVLAVLAAQAGQGVAGRPRPPSDEFGRPSTDRSEANTALQDRGFAHARASSATKLYNLPGHRRYREPEPEDTIS
ncbi:XRE family transcriptional regulator [Roseococcus sp. SYP-B2431]|uniref:helix-turn-helix domain-containing protein n=1 Tax=Roseococcus sp. SYP-B2431 TaxID=2496640 RepID=UPI001039B9FB|nr:helix-turn-helix transcriptional regulator [Roseococcus sp. SYP-B2431]TCH99446.1 XRE family transcriptional regulator [Roseococcus sp. SYP-B2431]